jgi:hypothetical protein
LERERQTPFITICKPKLTEVGVNELTNFAKTTTGFMKEDSVFKSLQASIQDSRENTSRISGYAEAKSQH